MKHTFIPVFLFLGSSLVFSVNAGSGEYFYCGYANIDGSGQDYSKWGKGTDFKYNKDRNRWEWITESTYQYIYPDGRYEQIARVPYFDNLKGSCNSEMEKAYKKKMAEITKKHAK